MDRFIVLICFQINLEKNYLKSNMDRFIADHPRNLSDQEENLKSNMDRFIADAYIEYADNPSI